MVEISEIKLDKESGLFYLFVEKAWPSTLAPAMAPSVPWVVVEAHVVLSSLEWTDASVPLSELRPMDAHRRRIRRISTDILMETDEFVNSAAEFDAGSGRLRCWQLRKPPDRTVPSMSDPGGRARRDLYADLGVSLSIDLPHGASVAQIASLERLVLESASERVRGAT